MCSIVKESGFTDSKMSILGACLGFHQEHQELEKSQTIGMGFRFGNC